jgi:hypothetical protein
MENRNRSRLESWEIAGEKEGHPETGFSRDKREEAIAEMGGCLKT